MYIEYLLFLIWVVPTIATSFGLSRSLALNLLCIICLYNLYCFSILFFLFSAVGTIKVILTLIGKHGSLPYYHIWTVLQKYRNLTVSH